MIAHYECHRFFECTFPIHALGRYTVQITEPSGRESLDSIISSVEMGAYPETQAGHYDLILNDWLSFVHH